MIALAPRNSFFALRPAVNVSVNEFQEGEMKTRLDLCTKKTVINRRILDATFKLGLSLPSQSFSAQVLEVQKLEDQNLDFSIIRMEYQPPRNETLEGLPAEAPPSPRPEYAQGVLRRHDTLFFLPERLEVDIPIGHPTPNPANNSGILRRQHTFFAADSPEVPAAPHNFHSPPHPDEMVGVQREDPELEQPGNLPDGNLDALRASIGSYSDSLRDTLEDCYEEIALQNTSPEDIPEGMSLEQYLTVKVF
ncbi:hypothetical protein EV361DRAFT_874405 [Lentinula raphanica]|nr:hypothetical protein EV361DRAFT_874405 [Lentinula raphanica]